MHEIHEESRTVLPTQYGVFSLVLYRETAKNTLIPVMIKEPMQEPVIVRMHSECFTSETLGSLRCDCKHQFDAAMEHIGKQGGMMIYLFQEGRGIGLVEKIKAYALQDKGKDTVEANLELGHKVDAREYGSAAAILKKNNISKIRLITNNPDKIQQLEGLGIQVVERIALPTLDNDHVRKYLLTKKTKMNHLL